MNHDRTSASARQPAASPHPHQSAQAAREMTRVGEAAYYNRLGDEALDWIRGHPRQFLALTLTHTCTFWFPDLPRFRCAYWLTSLVALLGLSFLFCENRFGAVR